MKTINLNLRLLLLLAAIVMTTPFVSRAQGSVETAAAAAIVGLVGVSGVVDDVMEKAANEGNYVVFNAASQLRLLIESFRFSTRDIIKSGFDRLDTSQQATFANIQRAIVTLQGAIDQPIENARQSLEEVHQIVNDGLPWMRESAVLRSSPSVVAPSALAEIPFTVRGISLDSANPRLWFGSIEAKRIGLERQQAIFTVPAKVFEREADSPKYVSGLLELSLKKCSWFVFCDTEVVHSELAVLVLPERLASVEISRNTRNEQRIYHERVFSRVFGHDTGDLTRKRCKKKSQGPHDPSYFIDIETLRPAPYKTSCPYPEKGFFGSLHKTFCPDGQFTRAAVRGNGRHSWDIVSKNTAGFTVELCAQSVISKRLSKEHGKISVNLTWKEFKKGDVVGQFEPVQVSEVLNWGSPIQVVLPEDTHAITIKLRYFDGSDAVFDGNFADKYVNASYNFATKQLIVRPKAPSSIAGIN
ncbi:hypothetical protein [Desulfatitalea alkaliphila]|uniref:Uncharacterized protein n=1 Tax=Desulfatitalea alkaliphila TaxID=2929485 RepID=A0AA41R7N3_9BACT|nr:hypothetical protein [Desulfatitalea alkaliphila]MCJ8503151.1 hypothetical protein [Desulfatitalea alkaliphila]